jgi:hypothetical protein
LDWLVIAFPTITGLAIALWPPKPETVRRTAFRLCAIAIGVAFSLLLYSDITLSDRAHQRELDSVNRRLDDTSQKLDESAGTLTDTSRKFDESNQQLADLTALVQKYAASVAPQDESALMAAVKQAIGETQTASPFPQERTTSRTPSVEIIPAIAFPSEEVSVSPVSGVLGRPAPPSNVTVTVE